MRLRRDTFALTAVLALLTSLGPLATDMYLPSLPAITAEFAASIEQTQLTLSLFMLSFALGQLVYGPISDRIGRRPVLLASIGVVLAADLACTLAVGMPMLIAARMLQGIATAGPIVLARSVVRDLYEGRRAGQELSRMGSIMGLVPAIAPFFGALIHEAVGWRMTFGVQVLLAAAIGLGVLLALPETIGARRRMDKLTPASFLRNHAGLVAVRAYRIHVALTCSIFAGLFAFISTSSHVLQSGYGQSEIAFGISFGLAAVAYVTGTLIGTRLVGRADTDHGVRAGAAVMLPAAALMLVLALSIGKHAVEVVGPMMLFMVGLGIAFPQAIAGAMMPFPDRAGAASSLLGFAQMLVGAAVGMLAAWAYDGTGVPLAAIIFVTAAGTMMLSRLA